MHSKRGVELGASDVSRSKENASECGVALIGVMKWDTVVDKGLSYVHYDCTDRACMILSKKPFSY